jgi:hypothetical protein
MLNVHVEVGEDRDAGDRMSEDELSTSKATPVKPKSKPKSTSTPVVVKPKLSLKKAGTRRRQLSHPVEKPDDAYRLVSTAD